MYKIFFIYVKEIDEASFFKIVQRFSCGHEEYFVTTDGFTKFSVLF